MTELSSTDFFTKKHARLTMIARVASVFAWVILIVQFILVGANFLQDLNFFSISHGSPSDIREMFRVDASQTMSIIFEGISIFFRGIVFWLILKGISVGLNMIVETDVNYRLAKEGGEHD